MTIDDAERLIKNRVGCNEPGARCRDCEHGWKFTCMMKLAEEIERSDETDRYLRSKLREQEPVKPITQDAWPNQVKLCGSCGVYITYTAGRPRYCPNCGWEMKWDG